MSFELGNVGKEGWNDWAPGGLIDDRMVGGPIPGCSGAAAETSGGQKELDLGRPS